MPDLRWKQRFENFERAYDLLRSALEERPLEQFSILEKEGIVQRFEYTFELAWKTIKDFLIYSGIALEPVSPRGIIKEAFAAGIIKDGQSWVDMLEHRNLMSHTYDAAAFEEAVEAIANRHLAALGDAYASLKKESSKS